MSESDSSPAYLGRPATVAIIACLMMIVCGAGLLKHLVEFKAAGVFDNDIVWIVIIRLLGLIGGLFLFLGHSWARWFVVAWMAYHVVLSAFHAPVELILHAVFLVVFAYFLFRPAASSYFKTSPRRKPLKE